MRHIVPFGPEVNIGTLYGAHSHFLLVGQVHAGPFFLYDGPSGGPGYNIAADDRRRAVQKRLRSLISGCAKAPYFRGGLSYTLTMLTLSRSGFA